MDNRRKIILRLVILLLLLGVVVVLIVLFRNTFSAEAAAKQVATRWSQLQKLPLPAGAKVVREELDGGAHYYGLDGRKTLVLDVTGVTKAAAAKSLDDQLRLFYGEQLQAWHPGLVNSGRTGPYSTVQGEPGLALITVELFDFEEAEAGALQGPAAAAALAYCKGGDGRGRRFAAVSILLCIR